MGYGQYPLSEGVELRINHSDVRLILFFLLREAQKEDQNIGFLEVLKMIIHRRLYACL